MSKYLVLTGTLGERPFTKYTFPNLEKYAEKCGADFIVEKDDTIPENLQGVKLGRENNKAYLSKLIWIRKYLEKYDKVLWLDDTCFVNLEVCPNLFDFVPMGFVAAVPESIEPWSGYGVAFPDYIKRAGLNTNGKDCSFNTGIVMYTSTEEIKDIFKDKWILHKAFAQSWSTPWPDQMYLGVLIAYFKIKRISLDSKFNRMYMLPKYSTDIPRSDFFDENGKYILLEKYKNEEIDNISKELLEKYSFIYEAFIYHMAGKSTETRLSLLKKLTEAFS